MRIPGPAAAVASGTADLAGAIDRVIRNLDEVAVGQLTPRVDGIEVRMGPLLERVDELRADLDPVRVVAMRFAGRKVRRSAELS